MNVSRLSLKLLLAMFAVLFLSGCSSDGSSSSSAENELKTVNLYFSNNEIFSFNAKTGQTISIANYDEGDNSLVTLNTDNEADGFEQFIYTYENTLYSLATDKTTPEELISLGSTACIFSIAVPDQTSFTGTTAGERILVDQASIFVTPRTAGECDKSKPRVKKVDFTDTSKITVREVGASLLSGEVLLDYDYNPQNDDSVTDEEDTDLGRFFILGTNYNSTLTSTQLSFYDEDSNLLWDTSLPLSNSLPTIHPVTETDVLIQVSGNLYLHTIEALINATTFDNEEFPTQSKIDKLFETPTHTLSNTDISELNVTSNGTSFALVDDGEVLFYDAATKNFTSLDVKDVTADQIEIKMEDNGTLLLHRQFTSSETLSTVNTSTKVVATVSGTNTDNNDENETKTKIDFYIQDNNTYINTYATLGTKATWINSSGSETSFPNSLFAFSQNKRSANAAPEIFLIASSDNESSVEGHITNASLYKFDSKNRVTGRMRFKDTDEVSQDFIFGTFNADIEIREVSRSDIFNDVYGKLVLETTRGAFNVTDTYYFNPTEQDSFETGKTNKALQLIETTE